jgi:tetratricopeptide (TPR) repeat protein
MAEAGAALSQALALDPADVKNAEALGNFFWATGQKDKAIAPFEQARRLSRLAAKPRALLVGHYLDAGKLTEAERCLNEILDIEPQLEGLAELRALFQVRRGNELYRNGDLARAQEAFLAALAIAPAQEEGLTNFVAVCLRTGREAEARERLARVIETHPNATHAYPLAARVAAQTGDRPAAIRWVERGLAVARAQQEPRQEQALRALLERLRAP